MANFIRALMPKSDRFFDLFEQHAATLVAGADALSALLDGGDVAAHCRTIVEREHEADEITRAVLLDVRRIFVTPFDRSAIIGLIGKMDDAIDQMNKTAKTITLYEVSSFAPEMGEMARLAAQAARLTAQAVPLLRSIGTNAQRIPEITERIVELEGRADEVHDQGIKLLFARAHDRPMDFVIGRELFGHLERVVDRFEDVANEIQGIVVDHA